VEEITLKVNGISCEHCIKTVTNAVNALSGVFNVTVDLKNRTVKVEYNSELVTTATIKCKIEEQGYDVYV